MNRRFVNLVVLLGYNNGPMYSLHRLDVSKHLFYPSIAEAEAANAKHAGNNNGGNKPPKIEKLRRLPAPSLRLQPCRDGPYSSPDDTFSILTPRGCTTDGEAGRILHTDEHGHTLLCDVQSCSMKTMPTLKEPKGCNPVSFAVPGAMPGSESLYMMRSGPMEGNGFEVLHLGTESPEQKQRRRHLFWFWGRRSPELKWQPLPPLPSSAPYESSQRIESSALLNAGRVICVSAGERMEDEDGADTYCFDTEKHEWWHAGHC
ncbi:hypothetical protein QOZ80_7BG0588480 [Eleusine coracana subsp. coracana]|nr:hypothetical protein QOZ80_7BG0588480 [Eleusine coracana subsp. coracana]